MPRPRDATQAEGKDTDSDELVERHPMAQVVCKILAHWDKTAGRPEELAFTWYDGPAAFDTYHVRNTVLLDLFLNKRLRARQALRQVVDYYGFVSSVGLC